MRATKAVVLEAPQLGHSLHGHDVAFDVGRPVVLPEPAVELDEWIPSDHADVDTVTDRGRRIVRFSERSRARLMYRTSTLDFSELPGVVEMGTFTYHLGWPTDGQVVKGHFRAWLERFERRWGSRAIGVWKLEFQERGAPHFHLYFGRPAVKFTAFCEWAQRAWHEITTGCADERCGCPHARRGFWLDRQFVARTRSRGKIAGYFAKHGGHKKAKQNQVPEGFENVGRFWGVLGMKPRTVEVQLSVQQMLDVRRALVRLRRARSGRRVKPPGRLIGLWSMCGDGFDIACRLLEVAVVDEWGELQERPPPLTFRQWADRFDPAPRCLSLV